MCGWCTGDWRLTDDVNGPGGVHAEGGDVRVLRPAGDGLAVVVQGRHEAHHAHRQVVPKLLLWQHKQLMETLQLSNSWTIRCVSEANN